MTTVSFALIAAAVLIFSFVSGKLRHTVITPPMVFTLFGLLMGSAGLAILKIDVSDTVIHVLAEITLVFILFTDASRIDLKALRKENVLPFRMLVFGLPGVIALGALTAIMVFPDFPVWEAALLAAILAPTDSALGQAVISSPKVPGMLRQTLNAESGLNDGIALPFVVLFGCLAAAALGAPHQGPSGATDWLLFGIKQLLIGPVVGVTAGYLGGKVLDHAINRHWMAQSFEGLGALGLAVVAFSVSEIIEGNGFIAAFTAGLLMGNTVRHRCKFLFEFAEAEGQFLAFLVFLIFGAAMVPDALGVINWQIMVFAVLSATMIRVIPVALSLLGVGLRLPSIMFLSWFGPRGIASILFLLLILDQVVVAERDTIIATVVLTVLLSIFLHGLTAAPAARICARHADKIKKESPGARELEKVSELPSRFAKWAKETEKAAKKKA